VVEAYRIVHNAGKPVTFKELCDKLPPAYRATAATWYREREVEAGRPEPAAKWTAKQKETVWGMWVQDLCRSLIRSKQFSANQEDGGKPPAPTAADYWDRVAFLPRTPPMVEVVTQTKKVAPWSPDADIYARRFGKGTSFTMRAKAYVDGREKLTPDEISELLRDGIEALAVD